MVLILEAYDLSVFAWPTRTVVPSPTFACDKCKALNPRCCLVGEGSVYAHGYFGPAASSKHGWLSRCMFVAGFPSSPKCRYLCLRESLL